jgi:hypothetical protein
MYCPTTPVSILRASARLRVSLSFPRYTLSFLPILELLGGTTKYTAENARIFIAKAPCPRMTSFLPGPFWLALSKSDTAILYIMQNPSITPNSPLAAVLIVRELCAPPPRQLLTDPMVRIDVQRPCPLSVFSFCCPMWKHSRLNYIMTAQELE